MVWIYAISFVSFLWLLSCTETYLGSRFIIEWGKLPFVYTAPTFIQINTENRFSCSIVGRVRQWRFLFLIREFILIDVGQPPNYYARWGF